MRVGIRAQLLITLVIIVVIPLLIAISITYFVGISQREETIGGKFQQLSEKARENIMSRLSENVRVIRSISKLTDIFSVFFGRLNKNLFL